MTCRWVNTLFVANVAEDAIDAAIYRSTTEHAWLYVYKYDNNLYCLLDAQPPKNRGYQHVATVFDGCLVDAAPIDRPVEVIQAALQLRLGPDIARTLAADVTLALRLAGYSFHRGSC